MNRTSATVIHAAIAAVFLLNLTALGGCAASSAPTFLEVRLAYPGPTEGATATELPDRPYPIYLTDELVIDNHDVVAASASQTQQGVPAIEIELSETAGKRMAAITDTDEPIVFAVFLDGELISAPRVMSRLERRFLIMMSGGFTEAEAQALVARLGG